MIDIVEIKKELNKGRLKVDICGSNILLQDTQTGKTTQLIYTSEATGYPIVVPNYMMKKHTEEMAEAMGCNIPEPITVGALRDRSRNGILDPENVLVDNVEMILKDALKEYLDKNVVCATMSTNS